jgi:hypothetical protein
MGGFEDSIVKAWARPRIEPNKPVFARVVNRAKTRGGINHRSVRKN